MPRRTTQLPPDATTLARRLAALEREVRELRASRRASWATIGGGDTTITGARVQTAETGHRVVLDAGAGALMIYDDDDHVTNYAGGEDNLIFNQVGWDDSGVPDGEWSALFNGSVYVGTGNAANPDDRLSSAGSFGVLAVGWAAVLESPAQKFGSGGFENEVMATLLSGKEGGQSGTVNAPALQMWGDIAAMGAVVKLSPAFDIPSWRYVPETWHTPSYNTGWSGSSSIGSLTVPALRYRQDAEDNLIIEGAFTAASGAGTAVFQLPAGYHPPANSAPIPVLERSGSTLSTTWVYVAGGGNFNLNSQLGSSVTAGAVYSVKAQVPLGNIP